MKLLIDHNLSPRLVKRLADLHPDSSHAFLLGLDQVSDAALWQRARQDGYTIVTKDSDFADLSVLPSDPGWGHLSIARRALFSFRTPEGVTYRSPTCRCTSNCK